MTSPGNFKYVWIGSMRNFEHIDVFDLTTAIRLLGQPKTEALAGGTDLLGELKRRIRSPERLVNLKPIREGREIRLDNEGLRIGALASLSQIEDHPLTAKHLSILSQAISLTATPQIRNMGTLGGNLSQHPRCWYYRNPLFPCWLKGGEVCLAVTGENKYHAILGAEICHAVHPSDLAPALIALDATIQVQGPDGNRTLPLEELYRNPGKGHRTMTILRPDELITEVLVPIPAKGSHGLYLKAMERKAWSFALASVAAQASFEGGRIADVRLVLGGVAPAPWRAREAEKILRGQRLSEDLARQAGEAAVRGAHPLKDNAYKARLARGLIGKALEALPLRTPEGKSVSRREFWSNGIVE
jgi:xanthine dehydrogenase YagS FAD-binding subunit